jgi:hypothetical protein
VSGLVVLVDGVSFVTGPDGRLRFGRQHAGNDIVLGSERRGGVEDTMISRCAGEVGLDGSGAIVVQNTARHHHLDVVVPNEPGRIRRVEPGDELRVQADELVIAIDGAVRRYELRVTATGNPSNPAMPTFDATIAETSGPLHLSNERLLDLAALAEPLIGRMQRVGTRAASYQRAAERRGVTRKALEKRIEHLVADLRDSGLVPGLEPGADVKQVVCEYAVRTGTVGATEVARLNGPRT